MKTMFEWSRKAEKCNRGGEGWLEQRHGMDRMKRRLLVHRRLIIFVRIRVASLSC